LRSLALERDEKISDIIKPLDSPMKIQLISFGIAKEILQSRNLEVELREGDTIRELKEKLYGMYPDLSTLSSISFAVGENYQEDTYALHDRDEVVIIPPVSGG
jgi:molybdopterin converting factor small subunit